MPQCFWKYHPKNRMVQYAFHIFPVEHIAWYRVYVGVKQVECVQLQEKRVAQVGIVFFGEAAGYLQVGDTGLLLVGEKVFKTVAVDVNADFHAV